MSSGRASGFARVEPNVTRRGGRRADRVDSLEGFPYVPATSMRITLLPQHKQVELTGRHRVADILRQLGLLPGTVMVIRNEELVTDEAVIEADDAIEIRNVISGG